MLVRLVGSVLLSTALFFLSSHAQFNFEGSIRPLSWTTDVYDMFDESVDRQEVENHCTTWAYKKPNDPSRTHWITAAHCVLNEETGDYEDHDYQIDGHLVYVENYQWIEDIASLSAYDVDALSLTLATFEPDVFNPTQSPDKSFVLMRGFPFGYPQMFTSPGAMMLKHFHDPRDPEGKIHNITDAPVGPGNSGSPLFNKNNQVIGVVQIGWGRGFAPISGASELLRLRMFVNTLP